MADRDQLIKQYRRLAKRADQRLVRLERYAEQDYFKGVKEYSYKRAMKDIKFYSGEDATRFNTKPPENTAQLQAKIKRIQYFLDRPTSTKKGIVSVYQKRVTSLNENNETNFTWQEFANFTESKFFEKESKKYDSKYFVQAVSLIKNTDEEIIKNIKKAGKSIIRVSDDIEVDKLVNKFVKEKGFSLKNMGLGKKAAKKAVKSIKKRRKK